MSQSMSDVVVIAPNAVDNKPKTNFVRMAGEGPPAYSKFVVLEENPPTHSEVFH